MAIPVGQWSFSRGEIAPALFGHIDNQAFRLAASTMRNMFVSFKGGAYSRAGTAFVGYSMQTGSGIPPKLVNFQYSIQQGLVLEFGNYYMRVISDGGFVTETPIPITGATQANPCVLSVTSYTGSAASPVSGGVVQSYAPGDTATLSGGTYSTPTTLQVSATLVQSVTPFAAGTGYAPGDTIVPSGGTQTSAAQFTVATTKVVSATVAAGGSGGTNGTQTVTGTTGTGTKFQASVTVSGGAITAVLSITLGGNYTVNPTTLSSEPVTGAGLSGARLSVVMGISSVTISNAGVFSANPAGLSFTQASSSGGGTGATFYGAIMAPQAYTVTTAGVYTVHPANPAGLVVLTGSGLGAAVTMTWGNAAPYNSGDWISVTGVGGMTQLNGQTYVVGTVTSTTITLQNILGGNVNSTSFGAYTSGGAAARIYTVATPWAAADLTYLKWTQSADVMSICCNNPITGNNYQPQDLQRFSNTNFVLVPYAPGATVQPPASPSATASSSGSTYYAYQITSIDPNNGSESVASATASVSGAVNIAATAGAISLVWSPVAGVTSYNVYKAAESVVAIPAGSAFGYAGTTTGTAWTDTNITPDYQQVPPILGDPFSPGRVLDCQVTSQGTGITAATATISTSTGTGATLEPVIQNGSVVDIIVVTPGQNYAATDTVTVTTNGSAVSAVLTIGPQNGTYPGVVSYYQQRRVYAGSANQPDTYWMTQPGAFSNFDKRIPTIDSDAITGTPWSLQVNGIQWLLSMPGGLLVFTGTQLWQLTGAGGSGLTPVAITPSNQQAQPQAFNGISPTLPPLQIGYDILFADAVGSNVYDVSYQYWLNIYTGADNTVFSSHLFDGYSLSNWAWCRQPSKVVWATRSDGALLSLTFVKEQQIEGWARHDTQGSFLDVCSVIEPPVNAAYFVTERPTYPGYAYMIERMDNRQWQSREDCWCVDCGAELAHFYPQSIVTASSATGLGAISGITGLVGGSGYSSQTTATVVDNNGQGPGTGAIPVLTIVGGVITNVQFGVNQGSGYIYPALVISDPGGGSGASATLTLNNQATFTAGSAVFSVGNVGSVIRMNGGVATITAYTDAHHVVGNITSPFLPSIPNVPLSGATAAPNAWTMDAPTTTISGLNYLAGATVTGLADGAVIPPTVVSASGTITLATPATQVIVGLGFTAQLQTPYLAEPSVQGQRKRIPRVTARVEASGSFKIGANQQDASTLSPAQLAATWQNMQPAPLPAVPPYGSSIPPLYTGDIRIPVPGGFVKPGQAAMQMTDPLPLQILAVIPEVDEGDAPEAGRAAARQEASPTPPGRRQNEGAPPWAS